MVNQPTRCGDDDVRVVAELDRLLLVGQTACNTTNRVRFPLDTIIEMNMNIQLF
jgi:hypothetical protein